MSDFDGKYTEQLIKKLEEENIAFSKSDDLEELKPLGFDDVDHLISYFERTKKKVDDEIIIGEADYLSGENKPEFVVWTNL